MTRLLAAALATIVALFMLQSLGRTIYVEFWEFEPAVAEWETAHQKSDQVGMRLAFEKEMRAHERTIDPFWFAK